MQSVQVPKILEGAKILPKISITGTVDTQHHTDDRQTTDGSHHKANVT